MCWGNYMENNLLLASHGKERFQHFESLVIDIQEFNGTVPGFCLLSEIEFQL